MMAMTDETLEMWLHEQINDAENTVGMYRSYHRGEDPDAIAARARLQTLKDVQDKIQELWGVRASGQPE